MEQLFTQYPNYFADQFGKSPKPENSIIDKYLESRMKKRVDANMAGNSMPSILKTQKNNNNLKQENAENFLNMSLRSTPAQAANTKASDILANMHIANSSYQKFTNSNLGNDSNEVYNFNSQNSIFSNAQQRKDELEEDESMFGVNFNDNAEQDVDILQKEEYLGDFKYNYDKELEKSDEKETASLKDSEERTSWDINDQVARILKLVKFDDETGDSKCRPKCNDENGTIHKANIEVWAGEDDRYSYFIFVVMVLTITIGSFLRSANRLLETLKIFFDLVFIGCWNWAKGTISPANANDGNLFLFVLCIPFLVFLFALYASFSIVYYSNKALLSRVPHKVAEHVNLRKIKELSE